MTITQIQPRNSIFNSFTLLVVAWLASYGGVYLLLRSFGIADQPFSNLIVNTVFLLTSIGCIRLFKFSTQEVGLKVIREKLPLHVGVCLVIFIIYWLYYLLVVRISALRPVTSATVWGLLNYIVVASAEEIYFRGLLFRLIEEKTSGPIAVFITGLLFGLVHFRQGLGMLPKFFTGWLWGSVRYATGMIFLLIFPLHFTYNATWLLFQGNWNTPSLLANLFPLVELLGVILIFAYLKMHNRRVSSNFWH